MIADARIRSDALAHVLDVGAQHVGEIRHLVHERDAGREHRIGRVFGELGRTHVHDQQPLAIALERRVHGTQQRDRTIVVGADDDAVGAHEILDRGAFLQEFRIRHDGKRQSDATGGKLGGDRLAHASGGADGNGRLDDDYLVIGHAPADRGRGGKRAACRRRRPRRAGADGDELKTAVRHRGIGVGREAQAPGFDVAMDHVLQSRLVDRHAAGLQVGDLANIVVDAEHVVASLRESRPGDEPHVPRADHRDLQAAMPSEALISRRARTGSGAAVIARPITR
jgi:hypothetical protein